MICEIGSERGDVVEGFRKLHAIVPGKSERLPVGGRAQGGDRVVMACRNLGERVRLHRSKALQGRKRGGHASDEVGGASEIVLPELGSRVGPMQLSGLLSPQLCELGAQSIERMRNPDRAATRAWSPQRRPLKRSDCARKARLRRAETQQRMLQQSEQLGRPRPCERRLRCEPGETSGGRVGKRIAAGIIRRNIPAPERR